MAEVAQQEPYVFQEYPKILYHPSGQVATVQNAEEEGKLGEGWVDSPAKYGVETAPAATNIVAGGYVMEGYKAPTQPGGGVTPAQAETTSAEAEAHAEVARLEAEAQAEAARREAESESHGRRRSH